MFSGSVFVMHAYNIFLCEQILIQDIIQCTFVHVYFVYIHTYVGSQSNTHLRTVHIKSACTQVYILYTLIVS